MIYPRSRLLPEKNAKELAPTNNSQVQSKSIEDDKKKI
jgi:hypothetical protein